MRVLTILLRSYPRYQIIDPSYGSAKYLVLYEINVKSLPFSRWSISIGLKLWKYEKNNKTRGNEILRIKKLTPHIQLNITRRNTRHLCSIFNNNLVYVLHLTSFNVSWPLLMNLYWFVYCAVLGAFNIIETYLITHYTKENFVNSLLYDVCSCV